MMEAIGLYLVKSAVWTTGFGLVYLLFLRNERFFLMNRIYLVAGILADQHVNIPKYLKAEQLVDISMLVGTYRNQEIAMRIEITAVDGEIYAQADDQAAIRLDAITAQSFECASIGLEIEFEPDEQSFRLKQDEATLLFIRESSQP